VSSCPKKTHEWEKCQESKIIALEMYCKMKHLAILLRENQFRFHTITPGRFLKKAICDKRCKIKTFAV
jgi:hypothetical protein